jgi:hypothetical protein
MARSTQHIRLMMFVMAIALTSACAAQPADAARTPEEAARELARLSTELGSLGTTLDRGADWALDSSTDSLTLELGREPSEAEKKTVRDILRAVLGEFMTAEIWEESITKVYSQHFSAEELDALIAFYQSPAGRKSLELQDRLTDEVDEVMGAAVEQRMDEFITRVDEELSSAFPELEGEGGS